MITPYEILTFEQRSPEWHAWRRGGIGGSDAAAIVGRGWKSADELLREKLQTSSVFDDTNESEAARRGRLLEPEARFAYTEHAGVEVHPRCLQSKELAWLRVSLDGLSSGGDRAVEIKCGERNYDRVCEEQDVPAYDYPQLVHILAVTGLEAVDYWCYHPTEEPVLITVERDAEHVAELLAAELRFFQRVEQLRARPPRT